MYGDYLGSFCKKLRLTELSKSPNLVTLSSRTKIGQEMSLRVVGRKKELPT